MALKAVGVFGSALIKKRKYWPKGIDGDDIIAHMNNKEVGEYDAKLGLVDNKTFYLYAMKEPNFVMMMMSTYGTLTEVEDGGAKRTFERNGLSTTKIFKYTQPFYNHYKFRHQIDDHNNKRHSPLSIEDCIGVKRWGLRQFMFLIAVTEINCKLAIDNTPSDDKDEQDRAVLAFRRRLAKSLIFNPWLEEEERLSKEVLTPRASKRNSSSRHELMTRPHHSGKYDANTRKWAKTKKKYPVLNCSDCKAKTRNYCLCDPAIPLCDRCFGVHCLGT
jgi:hypothetical protein